MSLSLALADFLNNLIDDSLDDLHPLLLPRRMSRRNFGCIASSNAATIESAHPLAIIAARRSSSVS